MNGKTLIIGGAVVVAVVFVAGTVGWAQQPRPQLKPVPTPAVPVPTGALPLHLVLPQIPNPAPPRTAGALAIPTPPAGGFGIVASAPGGGGRFFDANGGAEAWLGTTDYGIQGFGAFVGGFFQDADSSGYAYVGFGDYGITAYGNTLGGYFADGNSSGSAYVAYGDRGIEAYGNDAGGYFQDADSSGRAYVGYGDYGLFARGNYAGGYFQDANSSGYANVGYLDFGITAYGNTAGGSFTDLDGSGYGFVGLGDEGVVGYGNAAGGYFGDRDSSGDAYVGYSTYKIYGSGTVSFVQNHPADPGAVIVYAAPEGDEVATYTRGTARLVGGEARVALGETFKWVTNPDIGLTAHLTPRGEAVPLAVVSLSTEELVVRGPEDAPEGLVFDYLLYGLRIGFEESTVVQEKTRESYIPSMKDHRQLLARRPDLARYTALARYSAGREAMGVKESLKLEQANALKAAIHEFDPAVDRIEKAGVPHEPLASAPTGQAAAPEGAASVPSTPLRQQVSGEPSVTGGSGGVVPVSSEQDVHARSFSSPREQLATRVAVAGAVEPGDVLVVDREHPEQFIRGERSADPTVVGVVVGEAGVALGARQEVGGSAAVALSGFAPCKVDASFGAIAPGDLLVSAPTPGHAMREAAPLPGTVVGKALEPLAAGQGIIRVLVMLR
jgi:hypothetical protein